MKIELGTLSHTAESLEAFFRLEHDERRGEDGQRRFQSSSAFSDVYQRFRGFKQDYIGAIEKKLTDGDIVTQAEIDNVRTLQHISLTAEYDYKGDGFRTREKQLESGGTGGNRPTWKNLEMRAEHAGLLSGGNTDNIRVAHHRSLEHNP